MLKSELETAIGRSFSEDEYNLINTVYMYYPGIDDKKTVYTMYFQCGFVIFNDLYPRARRLADLEMDISKLRGGNRGFIKLKRNTGQAAESIMNGVTCN